MNNLTGRERAAFGDLGKFSTGMTFGRSGIIGGCRFGHIENIQRATGGGFPGRWLGRVVGDMVSVHDVLIWIISSVFVVQ